MVASGPLTMFRDGGAGAFKTQNGNIFIVRLKATAHLADVGDRTASSGAYRLHGNLNTPDV